MEIRENNHETSTPLVDSSLFDFIDTMEPSLFDFLDTLSPPVKPFTHAINHQPVFTPSPLSTCVHPSPQSSYPSRPGLSTDRAIVDDDTPDPTTPPDNQEWSGMIADLMRSPQHISEHAGEGILEGVAMSFYRSMFSDSDAPCPESGYVENEVINPNKKPRLEQPDSFCKRCKCQKSKCLMLYCGCFAAGVYCMEPCACINCLNKPSHKDMVLAAGKQIEARKPLAFAPKVTTCWDSLPDFRTIPRHRCICKKGCQMKYCGCSFYCKCEGSKNPFPAKENCSGQKLSMDHQLEKGDKRRQLKRSFQKTTITATTSGTCHLNKALEGGDSINDGKSDSVPSAAASNGAPPISATTTAELDQSFGDSLVSNVASPGSSTTTYDNNLHGSSLFVNASKPLVSPAFPVFGQQMASSAFGFSSQPHPFMSAFGHQAAPAVRQFPFHLSSQIQF